MSVRQSYTAEGGKIFSRIITQMGSSGKVTKVLW